jgi:hypothetical protein
VASDQRGTIPSPPAEDCPEREFKDWIVRVARERGWKVNHVWKTQNQRGQWITTCAVGWPDLTCIRDGRIVFIEVKAHRGRVEPKQDEWLDELAKIPCAEVWVVDARQWRDVAVVLT